MPCLMPIVLGGNSADDVAFSLRSNRDILRTLPNITKLKKPQSALSAAATLHEPSYSIPNWPSLNLKPYTLKRSATTGLSQLRVPSGHTASNK